MLASKVYSALGVEWGSGAIDRWETAGTWVGPNQHPGLSAKHIREACEASLTRLQTD